MIAYIAKQTPWCLDQGVVSSGKRLECKFAASASCHSAAGTCTGTFNLTNFAQVFIPVCTQNLFTAYEHPTIASTMPGFHLMESLPAYVQH